MRAEFAAIARHRKAIAPDFSPCLRVSVVKIGFHESSSLHRNKEEAGMRKTDRGPKSRNMSRYPIVLKDYGIVAYFARGFRYNEQALVYSGLLACNAGSPSEGAAFTATITASFSAAFTAAYGLKDRPQ